MPGSTSDSGATIGHRTRHWLRYAAGLAIVLAGMTATQAATVYKCVTPHGQVTFRDTPCVTGATQTKLQSAGQPLIDPGAPHAAAPATRRTTPRARGRRASHASHRRAPKAAMSWECRAADGEVFYRHARCPGSVPGDGTVRSSYMQEASSRRGRSRHNAWSKVPVHGVKVPRSEACRRIHSAGASGRDGHLRDDKVSTYDHLMGRDPCGGA